MCHGDPATCCVPNYTYRHDTEIDEPESTTSSDIARIYDTQASWDNVSGAGAEAQPASASKKWADLNDTERSAATVLGYTYQTWSTFSESKTSWSELTKSVITSTETSRAETAQLQESNSETSLAIPAAIGGVAVVTVAVAIVLVAYCFICKRKKSARSKVASIVPQSSISNSRKSVKVIFVTPLMTQGPRTRTNLAGKAPTKLQARCYL